MRRSSRLLLIFLAALTIAPTGAWPEIAQQEFAGNWFLGGPSQNWTCSTAPGLPPIGTGTGAGKCYMSTLASQAFMAAVPQVRTVTGGTQKYFFYVQQWGMPEGPGSERWGDSTLLFELPYSAAGAMGTSAPVYRGVVSGNVGPNDPSKFFSTFHSVFHDNGFNATYMTGQRVWYPTAPAGYYDGFKEIWVGQSSADVSGFNEGVVFNWSRLFYTTSTAFDVYGIYVEPDTAGKVWRGYLYFSSAAGFGFAPIIVDWLNSNIRYWTGNGVFTTIPIYGNMTVTPYKQHDGFGASLRKVQGRYELWISETPPRSGRRPNYYAGFPCPDNPYNNNVNTDMSSDPGVQPRWTNGSQASYVVFDPNTFSPVDPDGPGPLGVRRTHSSTLFPLPSDSGNTRGGVSRAETLAGQAIYYSDQGQSLCSVSNLLNWNHWSGSGIRFGQVRDVQPASCQPGPTVLCLQNNRFKVELNSGGTAGTVVTYSNVGGFFWLSGATNLEVAVKILDGTPVNGKFWVFHGALTSQAYTLTVTDTQIGTVKTYTKPQGILCGGADTGAFDLLSAMTASGAFPAKAACVPGATTLCLLNNRFQVRVKRSGVAQNGVAVTSQTGSFWFFASDTPEVVVKVLDGTPVNGKYWVFFGSLTDQTYQVEVTDTATGLLRTYNSSSPQCGLADTAAF